ncbi:MAG: universal stress protein [Sandaracinaceae bacterium]
MTTHVDPRRPHVILVGTDFSEASMLAVRQAWHLATQRADAQLHVAHVADDARGLRRKTDALRHQDALLREMPAKVRAHAVQQAQAGQLAPLHQPLGVHVRLGDPVDGLLQLAADLDAAMLVVGSHGKTGIARWLGSVSERLVKAGRLPVLVSRPRDLTTMAKSERLEPPCPDCVAARHASSGERWWCEVHARPHVETHVYSSTQRVDFAKPAADFEGALRPASNA